MRKIIKDHIEDRVETLVADDDNWRYIIAGAGLATLFFGFLAAAILNIYLLSIHSPLVTQFRASLTYKSAIFGDGILLPIVNMIVVAFLLKKASLIRKKTLQKAFFLGFIITAYFHVAQAVGNIVNWAMPSPWHWNVLGAWHAGYMFSVASLLSLFYLVVIKTMRKEKRVPKELALVTFGMIIFFVLLRLDYIAVNLQTILPRL